MYILYIIYLDRPLCNNYFFPKQEHCFEKVVQRICDLFEKVFLFDELEKQATNTAQGYCLLSRGGRVVIEFHLNEAKQIKMNTGLNSF